MARMSNRLVAVPPVGLTDTTFSDKPREREAHGADDVGAANSFFPRSVTAASDAATFTATWRPLDRRTFARKGLPGAPSTRSPVGARCKATSVTPLVGAVRRITPLLGVRDTRVILSACPARRRPNDWGEPDAPMLQKWMHHASRRKRSNTRTPNSNDLMGTRSSFPWNSAVKSRSAGNCKGANPKQRIPSRDSDLASVPPESV